MTERQQKYFTTLREGLERDTGKTLPQWAKIARKCPETAPRARQKWLKDKYGFSMNRASLILGVAFPTDTPGWSNPDALIAALWKNESLASIHDEIGRAALSHDGAIRTPRKGYTAYARKFQFAAARPYKGAVRLGLALVPAVYDLEASKANEGWSERLKSVLTLTSAGQVGTELKSLIKSAWEAS